MIGFVRRFAIRFVAAAVVGALVVGAGVVAVDRFIAREVAKIPRIPVATVPPGPHGANYLLVGSDSRSFVDDAVAAKAYGSPDTETGQRSDSIMVVHVEPDAGRTLVVSFPRDLWVDVPGVGKAKINASFNQDLGGGPDTVISTLSQNFGIEINHYLEVDFASFQEIVDAIGTVPIYVDRPMYDEFTSFVAVVPGCYQLDGAQALSWVRSRHMKYLNTSTGKVEDDPRADISRIDRQQEFIRRLMGLVVQRSMDDPFVARDISDRVIPHLRVDETFDTRDALELVRALRSVSSTDTTAVEFVTFPFTDGTAGGQAVLFADRTNGAALLDRLATFADAPVSTTALAPTDVRVKVLNASGRDGLGQQTLDQLVGAGFLKGGLGDDARGRVAVTEIRVASGAEAKAQVLVPYVGSGVRIVIDPTIRGNDLELVLGADFAGVAAPGAAPATAATAAPGAATPAPVVNPAAECR